MLDRRGALWRDRYHRHDLETPREVRNALVYVLMNARMHDESVAAAAPSLDPCSSALWFGGWKRRAGPLLEPVREALESWGLRAVPVAPPTTWLGKKGWRRHGEVKVTEMPVAG